MFFIMFCFSFNRSDLAAMNGVFEVDVHTEKGGRSPRLGLADQPSRAVTEDGDDISAATNNRSADASSVCGI